MNDSPTVSGGQIDWAAVHRRLKSAGEALAKESSYSAKEAKAVLKERARTLAALKLPEDPEMKHIDILEFLLSGETYAIETSFIVETFPLVNFTQLFCTPPFVLGIINLRGRMVSIVDIRRFFDLPVAGLSNLNRVIVVHDGTMEFGILADAVCGFRSVPSGELLQSLPTLTGIREEYLKGVTGERLVVLDGKKLINDAKIMVNDKIED